MSDIAAQLREDSAPRPAWEPILSGDLAERAQDAIHAIAEEIDKFPTCGLDRFSLPGGHAGIALFHAYVFLAEGNSRHEDQCACHIEQALEAAATEPLMPGLHGGLAGIAWTLAHLRGRVLDGQDEQDFVEFETELCAALRREAQDHGRWSSGYDLISGLVGLGVYALERLPDARARECLELVVALLDQSAERDLGGIRWFTPPEWVPAATRDDYPAGYYNFGAAHGIPGILALLGRAHAAGVARSTAGRLLEGAVPWLLAQEHPTSEGNRFPTFSLKEGAGGQPRSRLAWCYGDPGLAAALLEAARCVGEPRWEREALRIAVHAAHRHYEIIPSTDPGLCHGTGGLAHLFHRMYRASGEEALRDAAVRMFDTTLKLRRAPAGVAGFQALAPIDDKNAPLEWINDPGLLGGAAGVGLVLLAATTSLEPDWDRPLLLPSDCARTPR